MPFKMIGLCLQFLPTRIGTHTKARISLSSLRLTAAENLIAAASSVLNPFAPGNFLTHCFGCSDSCLTPLSCALHKGLIRTLNNSIFPPPDILYLYISSYIQFIKHFLGHLSFHSIGKAKPKGINLSISAACVQAVQELRSRLCPFWTCMRKSLLVSLGEELHHFEREINNQRLTFLMCPNTTVIRNATYGCWKENSLKKSVFNNNIKQKKLHLSQIVK